MLDLVLAHVEALIEEMDDLATERVTPLRRRVHALDRFDKDLQADSERVVVSPVVEARHRLRDLEYLRFGDRHGGERFELFAAEREVARKAGELTQGASIVVASYGTGRFAFEAVQRAGGRAVLS